MSTAGWRFPINVKLLAILTVPVLGYVLFATTAVVQAKRAADTVRDQANVVRTAVGPISLTTSLIDERAITSLEVAGLQDDLTLRIGDSTEARRATDEQLSALQTLIAENPEAREAYEPAVAQVSEGLDALRADVDARPEGTGGDPSIFDRYDEYIVALMDANAVAVDRVDDAEFWQGAMLSELATRQKHTRALLINSLIDLSANEDPTIEAQTTAHLGTALGAYETRDAAIQELATGPYARAGSVLTEALGAADLGELARNALATGTIDTAELFETASYKGGFVYDLPSGDYIHDYFRAGIVEILVQDADERTAAASDGVRNHLLAGSIGLVVTAGIAWLVSRSITRPLRALTQQVIDTATYRLPETVQEIHDTPLGEDVDWPQLEPIPITTRDEVADVTGAFNTMQQSALDLAVEEAVLRRLVTDSLVTLGQRNESLLGRQLDFITEMERAETDPDTLSDLFYLDHLSTRMRRNAESLLVLAGVDPPRTWLGPTPVGDIVRAALGEAEEYKRVDVQDIEPATVTGLATAELSHLLAELIDNALHFSPRGKRVEVTGRRRTPADDDGGPIDGYTISIQDFGVGMGPEELEEANHRLAGVESSSLTPSKYMGLYVSGKLAARHGITVTLHSNFPAKGITATIDIPESVLTSEAPALEVAPDLPPLPRSRRHRDNWDPPEPEVPVPASPDLRLLDLSAPVPLHAPSAPDVPTAPTTTAVEDADTVENTVLDELGELGGPGTPDESGTESGSAARTGTPPAGGATGRKSRRRKQRPIAASKLPVPPAPNEPLTIQPPELGSDPDQEGQAS